MAQTGSLSGVVTAADTGAPIGDALILARGDRMGGPLGGGHTGGGGGGGQQTLHATTDELGAYLIEGLAPGDYSVACGALGYVVARATVTIEDGQTTTADFILDPLVFGAVAGTVTDSSDPPVPIAGARVVLTMPEGGVLKGGGDGGGSGGSGGSGIGLNALTGEDGTYLIDNVPIGEYAAVAMAYGYTTSEPVPVVVEEGVTTENVDFALVPLTYGSLEGHVTDATTLLPIVGATVFAFQHAPGMRPPVFGGGVGGGGCSVSVETDEAGFYSFPELAAGTWRVRVKARGYVRAEVEVEILTDTTITQDFVLDPH